MICFFKHLKDIFTNPAYSEAMVTIKNHLDQVVHSAQYAASQSATISIDSSTYYYINSTGPVMVTQIMKSE